MNESTFKAIKVKASSSQVRFKIQYVIRSDNSASNFFQMIKAPRSARAASIQRCSICKSSQIWIRKQDSVQDELVYEGLGEQTQLVEIAVGSGEDKLIYSPSKQGLQSVRYISDL